MPAITANQQEPLIKVDSGEVAAEIRVGGRVQGVGFRPTVHRLARDFQLRGEVWNHGQGVTIRVAGSPSRIDRFVEQLRASPPPLARIENLEQQSINLAEVTGSTFKIVSSLNTTTRTEISPDAATCPACKTEIFDPYSRRYRYPFTNCTHCGPRLSIVRGIPYDRALTSMAGFPLCPECHQEYKDVGDRRFHAQPVACHVCGPHAWLERTDGQPIHSTLFSILDDVDAVCMLLLQGEIVAIKGLGGFHLACDATDQTAVQTLRQRKHRDRKPFALMARDLQIIENYCAVSAKEQELLESSAAPIVLLKRLRGNWQEKEQEPSASPVRHPSTKRPIAEAVAPDQSTLGFMLPYTPLHNLILRRMNRPIVLTSGNLSDEPQCIDNEQARKKLAGIADYLLLHDREIVVRVDDSVARVVEEHPQILRRARGYTPTPLRLPSGFEQAPPLLAMGSELKNTFCLLREGQAVLSQHLGDLEKAAALAAYQETLQLYLNLFEHRPEAIALDLHPEYLSSKLGQAFAEQWGVPVYRVQHHHAHIAACLAENGLPLDTAPVLGIALDGLGYGGDGGLWGGEFLLADYRGYQRLAHLKPVAMLGGAQAIYQPWRNTYAQLMVQTGRQQIGNREQGIGSRDLEEIGQSLKEQYPGLELLDFLDRQPRQLLNQMLAQGIHSPLASSCGRLFDAVAAAIGICREHCSYEGQAAISLETLATDYLNSNPKISASPYSLAITWDQARLILDPSPLWTTLLTDLHQGIEVGAIAARFHRGLAKGITRMVIQLRADQDFNQVALSGGVWQNGLLLHQVSQALTALGLIVITHHQVPPNDGGLSLGQAAIAAARTIKSCE